MNPPAENSASVSSNIKNESISVPDTNHPAQLREKQSAKRLATQFKETELALESCEFCSAPPGSVITVLAFLFHFEMICKQD